MPGLLIKDVPDSIHRSLKRLAEAHRRSLAKEALVLLEGALSEPAGPPSLETVDRLRAVGSQPLRQELLDRAREEGRP